jgi:putative FmdB family regulatory protein
MPIYEYRCEACGHYLETLQKISEPPLTDCHKCGKPALKKLVSAAAFRLKGGGWYETDFKTGKKKNVEQGEKPATAEGKAGDKSAGKAGDGTTGKSADKGKPGGSGTGNKTAGDS